MLARFERLMEEAVEGSLRRVFAAQLQPVQLAKAAARAMEQSQVIGVRGAEVANQYQLRLAREDLVRFEEYRSTVTEEVRKYLASYARDRHLRPVAPLQVQLIEDSSVRSGSVRAEAHFVDLAPALQRRVEAAVEGTRLLRVAELKSATGSIRSVSSETTTLRLVDVAGSSYPLDRHAGVIRIGRATDNDVVLNNHRVSRYHAQLRWVESCWLVYDLESTNGTFVDDRRVATGQPKAIRAGSRLRLGDQQLGVQVDGPPRGSD